MLRLLAQAHAPLLCGHCTVVRSTSFSQRCVSAGYYVVDVALPLNICFEKEPHSITIRTPVVEGERLAALFIVIFFQSEKHRMF